MTSQNFVVCDESEHNPALTRAYTRGAIILRAAFGDGYLDKKFLQNSATVAQMWDAGELDGGCVLYQPFISPGTARSHFDYLWKLIGPKVPDWLTGIMVDEESWSGAPYAQRGDKSAELNRYCGMNAHRMGSWKSVKGYANLSDFNSLWSHRDPRIDLNLAAYTGRLMPNVLPHQVAQQITDGQYKPPRGYPKATPPFGPSDHNVFFGVKDANAFRALWGRPPRVAPAPVPAAPPVRHRRKPEFHDYTSPNGHTAIRVYNDGGVTVRYNGKHATTLYDPRKA